MISSIQKNQLRMSKSKRQIEDMKKQLSEEDKIRLQLIDNAISRIKSMPAIDESTNSVGDINASKPKENAIQIENEIITSTPDQLILTEQKITKYKSKYNKDKYKQVDRTTAQVEPDEVVKNTYLSHTNLLVMKFIIDKLWAKVNTKKRGDDFILSSDNFIKLWSLIIQENENDIEIVLEEPLVRSRSYIGKPYKKKDIVRVIDILIKNVSVKVIDNVLYNSIEKLYRVNCDFVRLSDAPTSEITKDDF